MKTGLVSVTFRKFSCEEIIELCKAAKLNNIEWGSDVHVPQGDYENAERVRSLCEQNGISCPSYGSYFRLDTGVCESDFAPYLKTAAILKSSAIRIWAGSKSAERYSPEELNKIYSLAKKISKMSEEQGIKIATEFHPDTLTSNVESCLELLRQVNSQNFLTYFQPPIDSSADDNARIIARLNGKIENAHVFYWKGYERLALSEGISYWQKTLSAFENFKGVMYLEFVKDDSAENFLSDAAALNTIAQSLKISNR